MEKSLGQIAFEKWADLLVPVYNVDWENLPSAAQEGWEEIAQAVVREHNAMRCPVHGEAHNG